jgi:hypothetical protein
MEQLEQLMAMRDQAKHRLEAALAAIEKSPDARLVKSLTSLISDLHDALGIDEDGTDDTADQSSSEAGEANPLEVEPESSAIDDSSSDDVTDKVDAVVEQVESKSEEADENENSSSNDADEVDSVSDEDEFSLEESLEAELMGKEPGKGKSAAANAG